MNHEQRAEEKSETNIMIVFLSAGVVFGLSGGFSPGPLLTLVISQTLKHGIKEGVKVALAPLITDFPIILTATFVLTRLANFRALLGLISLIGGLFVIYLAYKSFWTRSLNMQTQDTPPQSLSKGALVNALNPHPYLFYLTVGGPTLLKAWTDSPFTAVVFVTSFLGCLVGAKVFVAVLAGKSRQWLSGRTYNYLMRVLGMLLLMFAFILLRDGLDLLGIV